MSPLRGTTRNPVTTRAGTPSLRATIAINVANCSGVPSRPDPRIDPSMSAKLVPPARSRAGEVGVGEPVRLDPAVGDGDGVPVALPRAALDSAYLVRRSRCSAWRNGRAGLVGVPVSSCLLYT